MAEPLVIAVVGAESTGKTLLARTLAHRLADQTGQRCTWVPEHLRRWCDEQGRTPQRHEQAAIAAQQTALIDAAAQSHDVVVCDTTALMTAVYSHTVFGDDSLDASALQAHRRVSLTLLMALVINPFIIFIYLHRNPYPLVFRCLRESGLTAFFTRSSAANIPVNMSLCEKLSLIHISEPTRPY